MCNKNMCNKRRFIHALSIIIFFLIQTPAAATVYKWVDDKGQVHYGAQPAGSNAEVIQIRTNETTKPRPINKADQEILDTAEKNKQQTAKSKKEEAQIKKEKSQYCNEAKSDLATINSRGRVRVINKSGEYIVQTEEQRQQLISAAKKKMIEFCQ
jgi:hypothetical protein